MATRNINDLIATQKVANASYTLENGQIILATGIITTSKPAVSATQTWNDAGVTFTGIKLNVTDTASASGSLLLDLQVGGASKANIDKSGNAIFSGSFFTSMNFRFLSSTRLAAPVNGSLLIHNNAANDFGMLMLGGTTSSFPAIKRSTTILQARLADDSAFATVQGKLQTDAAYTAGDPTTTGYIIVYDSTNTAYRIPALLHS